MYDGVLIKEAAMSTGMKSRVLAKMVTSLNSCGLAIVLQMGLKNRMLQHRAGHDLAEQVDYCPVRSVAGLEA